MKKYATGNPEKFLTTQHERDQETGFDYRGARFYDSDIARFLSTDPWQTNYPAWSTYNYVMGNPIMLIDPNGKAATPPDDFVFNEKGQLVRIDKNDRADKLVIENSKTKIKENYYFADTKAIREGTINKITFVSEEKIVNMLRDAGAVNKTNRNNSWPYMNQESKGGGKLDFSYSTIPMEFYSDGASFNPLDIQSPMLFLPEGTNHVHNHMNFGNFLWGAAGHSLGFNKGTLKAAAHYNSVFNSRTNGYDSQIDSMDDQLSISLGVEYSKANGFREIKE